MSNKRQQIVDALEIRMSAIDDIKRVAVWRASDLAPSELPAILIRDTLDIMSSDGIGAGRLDHELSVEVTAMYAGNTSATGTREIVSAIVEAIGTDPTFGGVAFDTILTSADIEIEDSAQLIAAANISIIIRYRSDLWTI